MPDEVAALVQNWHITHLFENVVPVLNGAGVTDEQVEQIFIQNPKNLFEA